MRIAFITEGGLEIGMGHVYRSLTLAEELKNLGDSYIYFLTKSNDIIVNKIKDREFKVYRLRNDDEIVHLLAETKPNIVIIDREIRGVEENLVKEIRDKINQGKVILFDTVSPANRYADVVVNAIAGGFRNKKFLDKNTNTLYFYGPRYLILRKEFYEFKRKKHKKLNREIKRILLSFGGSDPLNLTSKVLNELLGSANEFKNELKIDVILGPHFMYFNELNQVLEQHRGNKENINVLKNVENIAELMYNADLVMTSPGLTMFEALYIGTPVIAICQNLLQEKIYSTYFPVISINKINDLNESLKHLIFSREHLILPEDYRELHIGDGKEEVIEAITNINNSVPIDANNFKPILIKK